MDTGVLDPLNPPTSPLSLLKALGQVEISSPQNSTVEISALSLDDISFSGLTPENVSDYSDVAQFIRERLLQLFTTIQGESTLSHKAFLRLLFQKIDSTSSGELKTDKFVEFVLRLEIFLNFSESETNAYIQMLLEQIDINRGGTISIKELHDFIWKPTGVRELGYLLKEVRNQLLNVLSVAPEEDERSVLDKFVAVAKGYTVISKKRGNTVDVRPVSRLISKLFQMNPEETEMVMHCLDSNDDKVITSQELKSWIFPPTSRNYLTDTPSALGNKTLIKYEYDIVASQLRDLLLTSKDGTRIMTADASMEIFTALDTNGDGELSIDEFIEYLHHFFEILQLGGEDVEKYTDLFIEQFDINRDGSISKDELFDFLYPQSNDSGRELGIALRAARFELLNRVVVTDGTGHSNPITDTTDDIAFMTAFANFCRSIPINQDFPKLLKHGKDGFYIDSRAVRRTLLFMPIPIFGSQGRLSVAETDAIMKIIDGNHDGMISAEELKSFVFWKSSPMQSGGAKFLARQAGLLEALADDDKCKLYVYPSVEGVYINITRVGKDSEKKYQGAYRAGPNAVSFDQFEDPEISFECDIFILPELEPSFITDEDLLAGTYKDRAHILKAFTLEKKADVIIPAFVDTGADIAVCQFIVSDMPVIAADFVGTFSDMNGNSIRVVRKTNQDGEVSIPLPAGTLQGELPGVKDKRGKTLKAQKIIKVRPIPFDNIEDVPEDPEPPVIIIADSLKVFFFSDTHNGLPTVVLGDVSGSMSSGNRMECLKKTLESLFEQVDKFQVAFVAWDGLLHPCKDDFLTLNDRDDVMTWIRELRPSGGNDMKYAIEETVRKFPTVRNVIVMCDGDINPFGLGQGRAVPPGTEGFSPTPHSRSQEGPGRNTFDFASFRSCYPNISFHFAPFSEGADHAQMKAMADIGNGSYTSANRG